MFLDAGNVILRPFIESDRDILVTRILTNEQIMERALTERALEEDDAHRFIATYFNVKFPELGFATVAIKNNDRAIGFAGYRSCRYLDAPDVEFGWLIDTDYQGRGYATAVGEKLILHGLFCLNLNRVLAACNPDNVASDRVLRHKLNMTFHTVVTTEDGHKRNVFVAAPSWRPPVRPAQTG